MAPGQGEGCAADQHDLDACYYAGHDLRPTFTRDEVSRRRASGATLRRYLDDKQDKQCLNRMTKIRDSHAVTCNDDVVIVFAQQLIAEGKADDLDPKLIEIAESTHIPEREAPEEEAATAQ